MFKTILSEPQHRAQRYAIMPHLLGGGNGDVLFDDRDIRAGLRKIYKLRDARFNQLRDLGWPIYATGSIQAMRCCPPSFAIGPRRRQCRRYKLCPFCWARMVAMPVYRRVESLLFPDKAQPTKVDRALTLFEKVEYEYLPREVFAAKEPVVTRRYTADAAVAQAMAMLRQHRAELQQAEGSFHLVTLDPANSKDGVAQDWRVKHRVLAVLSRKFPLEELPGTPGELNVASSYHEAPVSKETLAAAVGRVCAYPGGIFTAGADSVAELLEAQSGSRGVAPRLSVYYGKLIKRR